MKKFYVLLASALLALNFNSCVNCETHDHSRPQDHDHGPGMPEDHSHRNYPPPSRDRDDGESGECSQAEVNK